MSSSVKYKTSEGYVKISNKELYDKYNKTLKNEYDQGISPVKFKEYLLAFGFTDALNRKKLEVPIPGDPKAKSRLCNIFTERVLRKIGIEKETEKTVFDPANIASITDLKPSEQGECSAANKIGFSTTK